MSPRLLHPQEAAAALISQLDRSWAELIIAEIDGEKPVMSVGLRPGVNNGTDIEAVGRTAWTDWKIAWRDAPFDDLPDVEFITAGISDVGVRTQSPKSLRIAGVAAAEAVITRLGGDLSQLGLARQRRVAKQLAAANVPLTSKALKAACRVSDEDLTVTISALEWLRAHPDLSQYTERQLPTPRVHTKWWRTHQGLIRVLSGRDPLAETKPRLAVVHLTYLDPAYLATGGRHHDAWTTGDGHQLAYQPAVVLVVENRDSRLWFPPVPGAIVVEGGGKAAASLLQDIPWVNQARRLLYWGDIDADGYAILNHLRSQLTPKPVTSILMGEAAYQSYKHLGVDRDHKGRLIPVATATLSRLTPTEAAGYAAVNSGGEVRRIEQERIPTTEARDALQQALDDTEIGP